MKKRILTLFSVFLLLVLAGCGGGEEGPAGKAFVGGNTGLAITFLDGRPPAEVYDSNFPFQIGLKLENKGEWNIDNPNNIEVTITGILAQNFGVSQDQLRANSQDSLRGVTQDAANNIVSGDVTNIEFPEMNYYTAVAGSVPFTIRANACYEYGTNVQGKLCVRKDLRGVTGEDGFCNPTREVQAENSGAPIHLTNIKQSVIGSNKIEVSFKIQNLGVSGDSLHKMGTNCDSATLANRNVVYIDIKDTGLGELTCSGLTGGTSTSGYVTLYNGVRDIRCTQTINNLVDLETPINIELKYGYKQYVDKEITVKHSPT